jgi:hypothetical protein
MADIDESDTIDPEDFSHQTESGEMKTMFEQKLIKALADLNSFNKIDFSTKNIAEPGAVVSTEIFHFLLGFPCLPLEFENKKIVGISKDSSFYPFLIGKKNGDQFKVNGIDYTILEIN